MWRLFRLFSSKLGIDKAVFFTSFGRIVQTIGGLVTIYLVLQRLTGAEQGYYYTFGSIVAIQIFFELGLNLIVTQYVAHEASFLKFDTKIDFSSNDPCLSRLSSLLHFTVKWNLIGAFVLCSILLLSGFIFFGKYGKAENSLWRMQWILLSVATSLSFLLTPILSYIEGLGGVKDVAKFRFIQQIISLFIVWGALMAGWKLYALGFNILAGVIILAFQVSISRYNFLIKRLWNVTIIEEINYLKEIFPFQWKIAISWVSGYLIYQLFNPVIFATEGAVMAGQMGLTLTALNCVLSISLSWINTKITIFSTYISLKNYSELDQLFDKTFWQSTIINISGVLLFILSIIFIRLFGVTINGSQLGIRFLPYFPLIMMSLSLCINHIIGCWAVYLRCHKREPYLKTSIVGGILSCLSTFILGKLFGITGLSLGYFLIMFSLLWWNWIIFKNKKYEWHKE